MYMTVDELNRNQIIELKEKYMIELAIEGTYAEVMNVSWDYPSMGEIAEADHLISDDIILKKYEGTYFTDDDFACTAA